MIVDLYAGCGGWSEGLKYFNLKDIGYDLLPEACETRINAGHNVSQVDLLFHDAHESQILIASPPCQTFSIAGKRVGLLSIDLIIKRIKTANWSIKDLDTGTSHVLIPGRWIDAGCETIMFEQVPTVLPIWDAYCSLLKSRGWSAWSGILNSADYGVPQTRKRAILIASKVRNVKMPVPTHGKNVNNLFTNLSPWVSMSDIMKSKSNGILSNSDTSDWSINTGRDWKPGGTRDDAQKISSTLPAPTLTSMSGKQWIITGSNRLSPKITIQDALIFQSFRSDYPIAGKTKKIQFLQTANAIPPLLAAHICSAALGLEFQL